MAAALGMCHMKSAASDGILEYHLAPELLCGFICV